MVTVFRLHNAPGLPLSIRAEGLWVNIDQEIRSTVCSNDLVYPALGLAGMSQRKNEAVSGCCYTFEHYVESARRKKHMKGFFFFFSLHRGE